eukprot:6242197-Lingulodinium_polyedra.AAC.1
MQDDQQWGVMASWFGPFSTWSARRQQLASRCILSVIGELEHRLIKPFEMAPFAYWVPLADPDADERAKLEAATKLFAAPAE